MDVFVFRSDLQTSELTNVVVCNRFMSVLLTLSQLTIISNRNYGNGIFLLQLNHSVDTCEAELVSTEETFNLRTLEMQNESVSWMLLIHKETICQDRDTSLEQH